MEESKGKDYSVYPEWYRELRRQIDEEHEKIDEKNKARAQAVAVKKVNNRGGRYREQSSFY